MKYLYIIEFTVVKIYNNIRIINSSAFNILKCNILLNNISPLKNPKAVVIHKKYNEFYLKAYIPL